MLHLTSFYLSCFCFLVLLTLTWFKIVYYKYDFLGGSVVKESTCQCRKLDSIPGLGRSSGEGNDNPLQCLTYEIPWTEETGELQFLATQRVRQDSTYMHVLHVYLFFVSLSTASWRVWLKIKEKSQSTLDKVQLLDSL